MKNLVIVSIVLFLVSCSPTTTDKKAELQDYKELVKEYSEKIKILEAEIDSAGGNNEDALRKTVVEVKELQEEAFASYFEAKGSLEALKDVYITPETSGQVKMVAVERGDRVKKGDLLIKLNTSVTQSSVKEVKTSLELATKVFEKQEQLWAKKIGSEMQFLEAKNAKESLEARLATLEMQMELASVQAPFDGIIDEIMLKTGELATPGIRAMRLVNLDQMRITAKISESFLGKIKIGDDAILSFSSYPEINRNEKIQRIGTVIDPITRTFNIEILLSNEDETLKPNMLSSIYFQDYSDESALVVPSIILKQDFKGTFLYVVKEIGKEEIARKVYVKPGKTVQDATKIEKGLKPGDQVIITGYNLVSDGETVSLTN